MILGEESIIVMHQAHYETLKQISMILKYKHKGNLNSINPLV